MEPEPLEEDLIDVLGIGISENGMNEQIISGVGIDDIQLGFKGKEENLIEQHNKIVLNESNVGNEERCGDQEASSLPRKTRKYSVQSTSELSHLDTEMEQFNLDIKLWARKESTGNETLIKLMGKIKTIVSQTVFNRVSINTMLLKFQKWKVEISTLIQNMLPVIEMEDENWADTKPWDIIPEINCERQKDLHSNYDGPNGMRSMLYCESKVAIAELLKFHFTEQATFETKVSELISERSDLLDDLLYSSKDLAKLNANSSEKEISRDTVSKREDKMTLIAKSILWFESHLDTNNVDLQYGLDQLDKICLRTVTFLKYIVEVRQLLVNNFNAMKSQINNNDGELNTTCLEISKNLSIWDHKELNHGGANKPKTKVETMDFQNSETRAVKPDDGHRKSLLQLKIQAAPKTGQLQSYMDSLGVHIATIQLMLSAAEEELGKSKVHITKIDQEIQVVKTSNNDTTMESQHYEDHRQDEKLSKSAVLDSYPPPICLETKSGQSVDIESELGSRENQSYQLEELELILVRAKLKKLQAELLESSRIFKQKLVDEAKRTNILLQEKDQLSARNIRLQIEINSLNAQLDQERQISDVATDQELNNTSHHENITDLIKRFILGVQEPSIIGLQHKVNQNNFELVAESNTGADDKENAKICQSGEAIDLTPESTTDVVAEKPWVEPVPEPAMKGKDMGSATKSSKQSLVHDTEYEGFSEKAINEERVEKPPSWLKKGHTIKKSGNSAERAIISPRRKARTNKQGKSGGSKWKKSKNVNIKRIDDLENELKKGSSSQISKSPANGGGTCDLSTDHSTIERMQLGKADLAMTELRKRIGEVSVLLENLRISKAEIEKKRKTLTKATSDPKQFWKTNSKLMKSMSVVWDPTSKGAATKARKDLKNYFELQWTGRVKQFNSDISHAKTVLDRVESDQKELSKQLARERKTEFEKEDGGPDSSELQQESDIKNLKLELEELEAQNPLEGYEILKTHIENQILNSENQLQSKQKEKLNINLKRGKRNNIRKLRKKKPVAKSNRR